MPFKDRLQDELDNIQGLVIRMELGLIGLGRMGLNMAERMLDSKRVKLYVWNRSPDKMDAVKKKGALPTKSVKELCSRLSGKKVVWLMLPSGEITEKTFQEVLGYLKKGDIIIDGANSNFKDSIRRGAEAGKKGILMLDIGVSGGIIAAKRGYPLMIGGSKEAFDYCTPIFETFAAKEGFAYMGKQGSGHYVKMVHNAVEYGMMQAIAEGFDLLKNGHYEDLDLKKVAGLWNRGCIVSSFLMEMTENALKKDPKLGFKPYIADSGEGKWAAFEAMDHSVPFVCNTYALHARYISRDENSLAFRLVAAMRNEFGGHEVKK
jgi:6-phosphogluconate dehydrogenase